VSNDSVLSEYLSDSRPKLSNKCFDSFLSDFFLDDSMPIFIRMNYSTDSIGMRTFKRWYSDFIRMTGNPGCNFPTEIPVDSISILSFTLTTTCIIAECESVAAMRASLMDTLLHFDTQKA